MSDQETAVNSRARSDASLTEDLVRLAASEERHGSKFAAIFFGIIFVIGLLITLEAIYRSINPLPGDANNYGLIGLGAGFFAMLLGALGVWAGRRSARKLGEVLDRH